VRQAHRSRNRSSSPKAAPVSNEIIINAVSGETRVAILEQNVFTELHIERESERSVTGMVTLGKVTRVLPGMQAAFVDIGLAKAAFLYAGDYLDERGQLDGQEDNPRPRRSRGRNGSSRQLPRIDTLLREGQEVVVQVAKDPIGTKGARITSHLSIAGRHLVLTPWSKKVGVSRRIESERERRRLREIVTRSRPDSLGFIIRTAGDGTSEADIEADVKYLASVWEDIQAKRSGASPRSELYREPPLPIRVIRDVASARTKRIVVDNREVYEEMKNFLDRFVANPKPELEHYQGTLPIFDHFQIESDIDANLGRKVWLKSGGSLIVDQSEALTAIDVNTGRFVGKRDLEETVLKTNLEAVKEVVHQLRFRNIGGLIIIDLIDMESAENREKVYRALRDALRSDKAKTNILKISELGLVEMTRKRTRENLVQQLCEPCNYCEGRGYVLSAESVAFKVMREIRKDLPNFCGRQIAIAVNTAVAEMLLGPARKALAALGEELGREIEVRARPGLHQDQFEVTALDKGPAVAIKLRWLEERKPDEDTSDDEELLTPVVEAEVAPTDSPVKDAPESPEEPIAETGPTVQESSATEENADEASDPPAAAAEDASETLEVEPGSEAEPEPEPEAQVSEAEAEEATESENTQDPAQEVDSAPENPILPRPKGPKES